MAEVQFNFIPDVITRISLYDFRIRKVALIKLIETGRKLSRDFSFFGLLRVGWSVDEFLYSGVKGKGKV